MSQEILGDLLREAMSLLVLVTAPPVVASMAVGFIVSALQAATQIQEQTIGFAARAAAASAALIFAGPWILAQFTRFSTAIFEMIATVQL